MTGRIGVGIDISKETVQVAISNGAWQESYPQTPEELQALARRLGELGAHRVVVEASGGYERALLAVLYGADVPVVLLEPSRSRGFARGLGKRAKTDPIDARVLAHMAAVAVDDDPLWEPLEPQLAALASLVHRRDQLVVHIDAESKRRRGADDAALESIERTLAFLKEEKRRIEKQVEELLADVDGLARRVEVLEEVEGVGRITAVSLVVWMPELGRINRREAAALAGLAPMNHDSGKWNGRRSIQGGRARVRRALYMSALSAIRHNQHIRDCYHRLRSRGKPGKVALVACMRKLLIHLNARQRSLHQSEKMAA